MLNPSHLNEHKFRHDFSYTVNHMWNCSADIEIILYCLLGYRFYSVQPM